MSPDKAVKARELLERGAYQEAATAFIAVGEYASAARAYVCSKAYPQAAECYEKAGKLLDAGRLYLQVREWQKAADLYTKAGDTLRADLALQQLKNEREGFVPGPAAESAKTGAAKPKVALGTWPEGPIWDIIRTGDYAEAARRYVETGGQIGWQLLEASREKGVLKALAETLFQARDYAVAAEAYQRCGEELRGAQSLGLAGLHEEAANVYIRIGQKDKAAQHLERAQAWKQAAIIYRDLKQHHDAARCHEKDDDPAKAAAMYLKANKSDLALPILQGIQPTHRQFAQCRILAAKILFQKNQNEVGVSLLTPLLDVELKSEGDLQTYYQLGILLETSGELDKARGVYLGLQKTRFGYADVSERLKKLDQQQSQDSRKKQEDATEFVPFAPAPSAGRSAVDLAPLRDCSILHRLDLEELRRLWGIGRERSCYRGEVLLHAGQAASGLYVILDGGLTITPDPRNPNVAVGFLGPGDYVGLGCLVQGPPQANALVAKEGTRLLFLPIKDLAPFLTAEPGLGMKLYRTIAEHLTQTLRATKSKPASGS